MPVVLFRSDCRQLFLGECRDFGDVRDDTGRISAEAHGRDGL